MAEGQVVDIILHCQKQIKKEGLTDDKLLHYLGRLSRLRVTVQDLADTGIGRTVNSLSRNEGPVGRAADTLVRGWKRMVSEQQTQPDPESEEESGSNSGSSEDEEDEDNNNEDNERYGVEDQEEAEDQDRRYSNGHSSYQDCQTTSPPPQRSRSYEEEEEEDEDDDIDDPYMDEEGGFLDMSKVKADAEDDEEDEIDDKGSESAASELLEIDEDEDRVPERVVDVKPSSFNVKQERQAPEDRQQKHLVAPKSSSSSVSSSSHKSHGSDQKKHSGSSSSSSKSHHSQERSGDRSHSKEHKHHHHHHHSSSKESSSSSSKDRSKQSASNNGDHHGSSKHKIHHHHSSSSKSEKSKETKPEAERSHHKDKDKHQRSKESGRSSHHDKEKESKSEKERQSKDKKESSDHRSSSSSGHKDRSRELPSSSTHSPKKSSLDSSKKEESSSSSHKSHDDRKRKELSSNSPLESSATKKSKLVLKEEIDSNSGINFADVLGSLDVTSTSKSSGSRKDKRKEEPDKGHRKHHDSNHHHHSSSTKKREASSSSKHSSSSRDVGSSSSASSSKKYESSESGKSSKKSLPQSKIESVIQPVVNISPHYKPSIAKLARSSAVSSSSSNSNGNGFVAPPPLSISPADLSDLGTVDYWENGGKPGSSDMSQEDAISTMLSSRNARSKVFSGAKLSRRAEVPSLYDLCMQVIKDNIGELGYTGGIPYEILKPALERANPLQLMNIEAQNDYLIGETDELWQFHCKRDFRGKVPAETESWRELYERCTEERQLKFEVIKKQMKRNIEKAEPVRKAKLAYVDTTCSTRFNHKKAQTIKNGMKTLKIKEEKGPSRGVASSASAGFNNPKKGADVHIEEAACIIAPESRAGHAPAPSVSRESSSAKLKPKKAPLMQKTMKLIKSLHRR